jgi:hypothetical protein
MSVGNLKTDGLKGNNFPWQLKMLKGLQGIINAIIAIPVPAPIPALSKVPVAVRIQGSSLPISFPIQSISIACTTDSSFDIEFTTDNNATATRLKPGETVNFDAGALNNFFKANLFEIDATAGGRALITYII